ncbi:hypothetical protein RIF29_38788 [Crotalaria pallida]|uniref:Reverse transcriptase zinc-binding domain-containing protein n=1 Tax=Crotalaria pallida TaxID=3830 RepID=A0AAN9E014_CROPI
MAKKLSHGKYHLLSNLLNEADLDKKVADFVDVNGNWNISLLLQLLPLQVVHRISAMCPPIQGAADSSGWNPCMDGLFTIKSSYAAVCGLTEDSNSKVFKQIWSWRGPQRIRLLLWKICNEALLTNEARARRHMAASASCSLCTNHDESILHALRDCGSIKEVWLNFISSSKRNVFYSLSLQDWLLLNFDNCGTS